MLLKCDAILYTKLCIIAIASLIKHYDDTNNQLMNGTNKYLKLWVNVFVETTQKTLEAERKISKVKAIEIEKLKGIEEFSSLNYI